MTAMVQPATDSEFAEAARTLAARLAGLARMEPDGSPYWTGDDLDPATLSDDTVPSLVHVRLDEGLLTGRAGIAVALAACSRLPQAPIGWARLAVRGADSAVRACAQAEGQAPLGWDCGSLGVATAAAWIAEACHEPALRHAAEGLAVAGLERILSDVDALPPWPDLLGGVAGILAAACAAPLPATAEPLRREVATLLVRRLDALSIEDDLGARWQMATTQTSVVGLAHGGSGIALALVAAARVIEGAGARRLTVVGGPGGRQLQPAAARARRLAEAARRWEDSHFDAARGGWPDLRATPPVPGLAWCHGAPGVGVASALLASWDGDDAATAASSHVGYLRAVTSAAAHRPRRPSYDATLCHGLGGVVELHLLGATGWPKAQHHHLLAARELALEVARAGQQGHPGWTCGIINGGKSPNLLVGIAGVALTLARCHDPSLAPSPADPLLGVVPGSVG